MNRSSELRSGGPSTPLAGLTTPTGVIRARPLSTIARFDSTLNSGPANNTVPTTTDHLDVEGPSKVNNRRASVHGSVKSLGAPRIVGSAN
jgi:hypothetical protein